MKHKTLIAALALALSSNLWAQTEAKVLANELEISGLNGQQQYKLNLQMPNKQLKTLTLQAGEAFVFSSQDFGLNQFEDGQYKYELVPFSSNKLTRHSNDKQLTALKSEKLSGAFTVINGQSASDQDEEVDGYNGDPVVRAPLITGDQSINNSLCVGFDCVASESYGSDTIRLKENNLRIAFDDTSLAPFALNDWEITANSSASGGLSFLGFTDVTAGTQPFTVEAGAGNDALYVESGGDVGIGTSLPVVNLHVVDGDSPTLRLAQDDSGGFAPQTWDMAGNETNFFVRDVTNGSTLPLRIRPGARTNSVYINPDGSVGMGTNSPLNSLHISEDSGKAGIYLENEETGNAWKFVNKNGSFQIDKVGGAGSVFNAFENGSIQIGNTGTQTNFAMDANGNLTIQGALTQNSDINSKENIQSVNPAEILEKVMSLPVSVWNYKFDDDSIKHLGPMAQDFFNHFGLGATEDKIATIDTSGVALASIKELGTQMKNKDNDIALLKQENAQLKARLEKIEELILNKN